jgi:choline transport protein
LAGTEIQGLIVLNYPNYVFQRWHGTLLSIAVVMICGIFNTLLARRLPLVEGLVLILHILGFFAITILLWVFAPRSTASDVIAQFTDAGGWGSTGLACLVGIISPTVSLLGSDAATHMSDELKDARKTLPKAMISTAIFNGILGS